MVGFLCDGSVPEFVRNLMQYAAAYAVPFCAVPYESLNEMLDGKTDQVMIWKDGQIENAVSALPEIMDFPMTIDSKKAIDFFGADFLEKLSRSSKLLRQRSLCKERLMSTVLNSPLSIYAIPSYRVISYDDIVKYMRFMKKGFLKPSGGRQGIGTGKVYHDTEGLVIEDRDGSQPLTEAFCETYFDLLESRKLGEGLLQPCLDFSLNESHAVDFRLLRHRGLNGAWEETATYARVGETTLVSNVSQGGFFADAKDIVNMIAGEKADGLYDEIMMLGRELPALIQRVRGDDVYCLGLDIAIDRESLRPFVLEANTYPGTKFHLRQHAESRVRFYHYLINK